MAIKVKRSTRNPVDTSQVDAIQKEKAPAYTTLLRGNFGAAAVDTSGVRTSMIPTLVGWGRSRENAIAAVCLRCIIVLSCSLFGLLTFERNVQPWLLSVRRSSLTPLLFAFPDLSQLAGCGSTFYASGYDTNGNKDGLVLMQTLSGVTVDDGREVVACVQPGKYPAGSEVVVESRHVVDKPHSLDWERAAMLPFLVRRKGLRLVDSLYLSKVQPLRILVFNSRG